MSESHTFIYTRERERERERERKYTVNVQCSVQYTLLLLYLMLMLHNLSIKLYRIYAYYTNITLYDVTYNVWYYPWFSVTAVGLGTY